MSLPNTDLDGFLAIKADATCSVEYTFAMPVRLLAPHVKTGQDTLAVTRGPLVYAVESIDNTAVDDLYPHFVGVGLDAKATFEEIPIDVEGFGMLGLRTKDARVLAQVDDHRLYRETGRSWKPLEHELTFVPYFARANRGGAGRLRTSLLRASNEVSKKGGDLIV